MRVWNASTTREACRKLGTDPRFSFHQGSAAALPLASTSFDLACSTISFHHWDDQEAGVREIARVLRPSGLFVLADIHTPLLSFIGPLTRRLRGTQVRSPRAIRRLFKGAGLVVLTQRSIWTVLPTKITLGRKG